MKFIFRKLYYLNCGFSGCLQSLVTILGRHATDITCRFLEFLNPVLFQLLKCLQSKGRLVLRKSRVLIQGNIVRKDIRMQTLLLSLLHKHFFLFRPLNYISKMAKWYSKENVLIFAKHGSFKIDKVRYDLNYSEVL